MNYRLVLDLEDAGYQWWSLWIPFLLVAVLASIIFVTKGRGDRGGLAVIMLGVVVLFTIVGFAGSYNNFYVLRAAKRAGQVDIVEGLATNFKAAPVFSRSRESFCVKDKCFHYSHNAPMGGFINNENQGGPIIKDGLPVRITAVGNTIVRLEVAEPESQ